MFCKRKTTKKKQQQKMAIMIATLSLGKFLCE